MKKIILLLVSITILSCKTSEEKSNEKLLQLLKKELIQNEKTNNDYISNAYNIPQILNLERIKKDKNFKETEQMILKNRKLLKSLHTKTQNHLKRLDSIINALQPTRKLSMVDINQLLKFVNIKREESKSTFKSNYACMDKTSDIINFLKDGKSIFRALKTNNNKKEDAKCKYIIKGNKIYFYNDDCLESYNLRYSILNVELIQSKSNREKHISQLKDLLNENKFLTSFLRNI